MSSSNFTLHVTPRGTFIWPKLVKPDVYKENGVPKGEPAYKTGLRLKGKDASDLIAKLEAAQNEAHEESLKAMTPAKREKAKKADLPYKKVFDDQGAHTGDYDFNFAQKAVIQTKLGEKIDKRPVLVDATRKPIEPIEFSSGSEGKIAYTLNASTNAKGETYVSMRPRKVQLLKVVTYGGSGEASEFDVEEDGFEGTTAPVKGVEPAPFDSGEEDDGSSLL